MNRSRSNFLDQDYVATESYKTSSLSLDMAIRSRALQMNFQGKRDIAHIGA